MKMILALFFMAVLAMSQNAVISFNNYDQVGGTFEVWLNSDANVAGFQFNVDGVTPLSASGGVADLGWMVTMSGNLVLGVDLSGSNLLPGDNLLTVITFVPPAVGQICPAGGVISGASGQQFSLTYGPCLGNSCDDPAACNYLATESCIYPTGCNGWCPADPGQPDLPDCNGDCGGSAFEDACGCVEGATGLTAGWCMGCTDPAAVNYDPLYTIDDGSCTYSNAPQNLIAVGGDQSIQLSWDAPLVRSDVEYSITGYDSGTGQLEISMTNLVPVGGFQFTIISSFPDFAVSGASGGIAGAAGYILATNATGLVLGFSMVGTDLPAGTAVLCYVDVSFTGSDGSFDFTDPHASDSSGLVLSVTTGPPFYIGQSQTSYILYRDGVFLADGITGTTYLDAPLGYSESYCYTVTALNGGVETGPSNEACATTDALNVVYGCMDASACNFDATATQDDGSCIYAESYWPDADADGWGAGASADYCPQDAPVDWVTNDSDNCPDTYNPGQADGDSNGIGDVCQTGCTDPGAMNYDPFAGVDDGSCSYSQSLLLSLGNLDEQAQTIEVLIDNPGPLGITGIEFYLSGADLSGGSGGMAGAYGLAVSAAGTHVVGFSFSNTVIPPGSGVLTVLSYNSLTSNSLCLNSAVFTGPAPDFSVIDVTYGPCIVFGCTDSFADNFNPDATLDDGSCQYLLEHFIVNTPDTGVWQLIVLGNSITGLQPGDEVGFFDADALINSGDCSNQHGELLVGAGVWNGSQVNVSCIGSLDNCGIGGLQFPGYVEGHSVVIKVYRPSLVAEYSATADYSAGTGTFGDLFMAIDEVFVEIPGCIDPASCTYDETATVDDGSCLYNDCTGTCGGTYVVDDCGDCVDPVDFNSAMDCAGVCYGDHVIDDCSDCVVPDQFNAAMDCAGVCDGDHVVDDCADCVVPDQFNAAMDCAGVCDGDHVVDDCSDCVVPDQFNAAMDCAGVCYGDHVIDDCSDCVEPANFNDAMDCAGVCDGDHVIDDCSYCVEPANFNDAMDCAGVCDGDHVVDDCSYCVEPANFNDAMDCAGVCDGDHVVDDCDDCVDPGDFNAAMDCAGVCDGIFVVDDCDDCVDPGDFNAAMDCAGVCDGNHVIDDCVDCVEPDQFNAAMDCAGVCDGSSSVDDCGVCDDDPGNDNACFGCTDPDALNYDPDATVDDGSCDYLVPGDINHDGHVNVTDVVEFVGLVLFGTPPTDYQLLVGDLYQPPDGQLTILDLVILVELAIGPSMNINQPISSSEIIVMENAISLTTDGTPAGIQLEVSGTFDLLPDSAPPGWDIYSSDNRIILLTMSCRHRHRRSPWLH